MSKNWKGGLDQYDTEHFGSLIFATVRKSVGLKGLTASVDLISNMLHWCDLQTESLFT